MVLSSDTDDRLKCIEYIDQKLRNSGFHDDEIKSAKQKALTLNRDTILNQDRSVVHKSDDKKLTFLINRDGYRSQEIKKVKRGCNPDIDKLLGGKTRIVVAERKNSSIASAVFAKSAFSDNVDVLRSSQKCNKENGCMSCEIMNCERKVTVW